MPVIQTEIRVADILTQYQSHSHSFVFICYAIAYKLNEEYEMVRGDYSYGYPYHWLNAHAGDNVLSNQIDFQLREFIRKLNPQLVMPGSIFGGFFLEYGGSTVFINKNGTPEKIKLSADSHKFRQQFLKFIVEMDPEAVFSVNLQF
jgi:hypothetical protein